MNSKGHAMMVALVILATRGPPRASEFRRRELPELLFFRPLSYLACAMKRSPGRTSGAEEYPPRSADADGRRMPVCTASASSLFEGSLEARIQPRSRVRLFWRLG